MKNLSQTWNLETFFAGGSESPELVAYLDQLEGNIEGLAGQIATLSESNNVDAWGSVLAVMQQANSDLRYVMSFSGCLLAQDVKDQQAKIVQGRIAKLSASLGAAMTVLDKQILTVDEQAWQALLQDERVQPISFWLIERRQNAFSKMAPDLEALGGDLAVDGYHAWGNLYNTLIGRMSIKVEKDGEVKELSIGQAQNMYSGTPDREVRKAVFAAWEEAFAQSEELFAANLNHLGGFRWALYKSRGWDSILKEPCDINRMSRATLDVMWDVIDKNKDTFVQFLDRKAELIGVDKLSYYDLYASTSTAKTSYTYDEGANFIVEQFAEFSPDFAAFAKRAFEQSWIEAEDRPGKRPGGFCAGFPGKNETRIFMTYDDSMGAVSTLAHELGHAYHAHVMGDMPFFTRMYAMNVAETASTFAETLVTSAAVRSAKSDDEKIALLEEKVSGSIAMYMDIHSRFIFENNFYDERKKGLVSAERLNELMVEAQKKAYRDSLELYHPRFWASKLHFYSTSVPFYNFPYTFGYLFSTGVYALALQEGPSFADKYVALLRDTASMTVEELAQKHLGVDLTQPEFWQNAVDITVQDAKEFLRLTAGKVATK
ncbi:oligoendopeptidase [Tumebacillus algifaecis]|uniref:Oligoendopeptidase n=1 Tax=Tumebacillus algifaecis TaxID=1214604 RepID=A0A223CZL9_9BACL|nr:M3 family oligoendopeptidase [Tumebacillus algifaecis]ASS74705.1 oligoendopeptidase [Tumebacillus algifaecis]